MNTPETPENESTDFEDFLNVVTPDENIPMTPSDKIRYKEIFDRITNDKRKKEYERLIELEKKEEERKNETPEKSLKRIIEESVKIGIEKYKESLKQKEPKVQTERQEAKFIHEKMMKEYKELSKDIYKLKNDTRKITEHIENVIKQPVKHYLKDLVKTETENKIKEKGTKRVKINPDKIKEMFVEGKTKKEIAEHFQITENYLSTLMSKNSIKVSDYIKKKVKTENINDPDMSEFYQFPEN